MTDLIPVIRGKMGGREYYVGTMTFQDVAAKVQFFDELKESADLDQLLQREIQRRSEDMKTYLLQQDERFLWSAYCGGLGRESELHKGEDGRSPVAERRL